MQDGNGAPAPRGREVRIGLVMYGGVSLAVYMNGVANELFRAVRGRGVYKLFKALTDSDVVVDVISGASAGGINGMFLAYALCNDKEFGSCAQLWREHGDIMKLLRSAEGPPEAQTSLLDSEGFYQPRLTEAFRTMWFGRTEAQPGPGAEAPSPVKEVDLFVTGTDFAGRIWNTVDAAGHVIDVKDHRTLFWLKHRQGRKCQLHPAADAEGKDPGAARAATPAAADAGPLLETVRARDALETGFSAFAKLARITSCFPAAFAPVSVEVPAGPPDAAEGGGADEAVDRKLALWGDLPPGEYSFLDGGILDNKPFSSTVRAIFYRMADRPVQRHLLYVEPDPEQFRQRAAETPTFLSSALDSLTRLPSYESIADDLRLIGEHNDRIERYKRTCAHLRRGVMTDGAPAGGGPPGLGDALYERARLEALGDVVAESVLNIERQPGSGSDERDRGRLATLRKSFDHLVQGQDAAAVFERYDADFRLRRLIHLTYVLLDEDTGGVTTAPTPGQQMERPQVREALDGIGRRVELLEIVRAYMQRSIEARAAELREKDAADLWRLVSRRLDRLLDTAGLPEGLLARLGSPALQADDLEELKAILRARAESALGAGDTAPPAPAGNLLAVCDRGEAALVARFAPVAREHAMFPQLDRVLFPMQFVAELYERDIIRTVRISPLDAQRGLCQRDPGQKLCGETVAHFGAFLKRSWRSNDILWGRLDGACQLVETLLNPHWIATTLGEPAERRRVLRLFGVTSPEDLAARARGIAAWLSAEQIFPRAGEAAIEAVAQALAVLLEPADAGEAFAARAADQREALLDALVEAAHLDILATDMGEVIEDAIREQLVWKQGRTASPAAAPAPGGSSGGAGVPAPTAAFDPGTRAFDITVDDAVLTAAAHQLATKALEPVAGPAERGRFFRTRYRVGGESVERDIPRLVLLEIVAHALLVVRNCVINSLGAQNAADVRGNHLYKLVVDWPLRTFHFLARTLRGSPTKVESFLLGTGAYVALAVFVNVAFPELLAGQQGLRHAAAVGLFVVLPAAALGLAVLVLLPWTGGRPRREGGWPLLRLCLRLSLEALALGAVVGGAYWLSEELAPAVCGADVAGTCGVVARSVALLLGALAGVIVGAVSAVSRRTKRVDLADVLARSDFSEADVELLGQRTLGPPAAVTAGKIQVTGPGAQVVLVTRGKDLRHRKADLVQQARAAHRSSRLEREMRRLRPDAF